MMRLALHRVRSALVTAALISLSGQAWAQKDQHASYKLLVDKDNGVIVYLPDAAYTPGIARTTLLHHIDPKTGKDDGICGNVSTREFRKTSKAMKAEVDREYGIAKSERKNYQGDHLISLFAGGADVISNIWDQPYPQAHWKDLVDVWVHKEICEEGRDPVEIQKAMATNWYALYEEMKAGEPKPEKSTDDGGPHAAQN